MKKLPTSLPKFFYYFVKKRPIQFFIFFLLPISVLLETNLIPYVLKIFIDKITYHQPQKDLTFKDVMPELWMGGMAWFGLIIIMRLQNWWQAYAIPRFEADIRMVVIEYIMHHSYYYFFNQLAGNVANKIRDLPKSIESIRMIICNDIVSTFAVILATLIMTAKINHIFSWILGLWVVTQLIITIYFVKFVSNASKENAEDKSALSGSVVDTISNIVPIKLFSRTFYELTYITKKQEKEKESNTTLIKTINIFQIYIDIAVSIMLVGIVYFLILRWQQGIVSVGDFIFIFNMTFCVIYRMWQLSRVLSDLFREIGISQQALVLITHPHQIIDAPDAKPIKVTKGKITFNSVTFHYHRSNDIFKNKNVTIKAGQKVGLVGYSGSGKSTFINLILRIFDISSGTIMIDNQDITKVTQESLRENIAVIPQDPTLFHRTIMENIRYGKINATDEEVIIASQKAYCDNFINSLPDGYNALVGERGVKLSGGQRQRIAIARAMLKNAPILILDEATSALDSVTEKSIQDGLHNLMNGRTTVVIAHRLSTLAQMDRILVFNNGQIIEDGTHQELLKLKGVYESMWRMQVDGFLPEKF